MPRRIAFSCSWWRAIIVAGAVVVAATVLPEDALAHAVLVDSVPAAKAEVNGAKVEFNLHYNSRIDASRSRLSLKGPQGSRILGARQGKTEADLSGSIAGLEPGHYMLLWDVLSVDGHVSRGQVPFSVAAP
ncbi:conserved hypothetical protein [Candidatus Terasakiella magnetica]|nr:conserved hypothetical protein [Candidatus Terasakiella magnetica]